MIDLNIVVTKPYRASIADVPAQAIVASLPEMAIPLTRNTYAMALSKAKLRHAAKRLRFVEAKITLNGYRLTIIPKGPLAHLLDAGAKPHSLAPRALGKKQLKSIAILKAAGKYTEPKHRATHGMHPGFPGRHFMPAALAASLPEMQRILDRNTRTYLAKQEVK